MPKQTEQTIRRPRSVTIIGWLLLFQSIGLTLIGVVNFSQVDFEWEITQQDFYVDLPASLRGWAFVSIALLAMISSMRFFRVRRSAWMHAMLVQGLSLSMAIGLYLQTRPFYVYLIMINCVFMVVYLNYSDVLLAFRADEQIETWGNSR